MSKAEEKVESTEKVADKKATRLYNFTRHNFSVEASSQEEAEEALEKHLKEQEKETK